MSDAIEMTRKVYWSPTGELATVLQQTTYIWLAIALAIMAWGVWRRIQIWKIGKPEAAFDRPMERLVRMLKGTLGQSKVLRARRMRDPKPRSYYAAWMHGLIFYGFMALVFATTIVALKEYGVIDLYYGSFYAFVVIVSELGGLALTVGLGMGVFRRSTRKDEFKHALDYFMHFFLFCACRAS
jgi:hypothetical protein